MTVTPRLYDENVRGGKVPEKTPKKVKAKALTFLTFCCHF
jgi:hypothetical protein